MRSFALVFALMMQLALPTLRAAEPAAAAEPVDAVQVPAATVTTSADGQLVTLSNELFEVELFVPEAAIRAVRLHDMYPIQLPGWLDHASEASEQTGVAEQPVDVLGPYHPEPPTTTATGYVEYKYYHSWLVGLPGDVHWTLVEGGTANDNSVTFVRGSGQQLQFMRYELQATRPTIGVNFWAVNRTDAEQILAYVVTDAAGKERRYRPSLCALNGVHHDLGQVDARYGGLYVYSTADEGMDSVSMPTETPINMLAHRWIAQRTRFFAAYWSHVDAQLFTVPTAEPLLPALVDGSAVADGDPVVPWATANQYLAGEPGPMQQMQALVRISYYQGQDRVDTLAPGQGLHLAWNITAAGLSKTHLARLDDSEKELEYTSGFYRFFRVLSILMTNLLGMLYGFFAVIGLGSVGYGLAVIALTFLIKLALHRLNFKAQKSMLTMQKIGPELKALQAKYGSDRQAFAQKQMELFKKHQVNPLGGCLPMLLQFPIFIALYQAFSQSAELRGQSFLWVPDLTLPDYTIFTGVVLPWWGPFTINLLPIAYIGVALWMAFSTKPMAAANADKTQQDMAKMMRFLPVVFGLIFYNMPAGLVLYFTISMVLSVIENRYVRRKLGM